VYQAFFAAGGNGKYRVAIGAIVVFFVSELGQLANDAWLVRCAIFDGNLHPRMPLVPTPARLKLLQACDQWHSSRMSAPLTGSHCKLRPNTEGCVE
jgi:hypothetical protein